MRRPTIEDNPTHCPVGKVVSWSFVVAKSNCVPTHVSPPQKPRIELYRYDEDAEGWVYDRDRTPEEMAEALAKYEEAKRDYVPTVFEARPTTFTLDVTTEEGAKASAIWGGDAWVWISCETDSSRLE